MTCYENMSRRMGDKRVFGKGLSAKMNFCTRRHNSGNGPVVRRVPALICNDSFSNTALCDLISKLQHISEPTKSTWVKKSLFLTCVEQRYSGPLLIVLNVLVLTIQI